jgi:hypothetical protein
MITPHDIYESIVGFALAKMEKNDFFEEFHRVNLPCFMAAKVDAQFCR